MIRVIYLFLCMSLSVHTLLADDYTGTRLLEILGEDKNSDAFTKFKTQYLLDKALKNPVLGIKLTAVHDSASIITALTVTAEGYEMNDIKYKQFEAALPFDISLNDDFSALEYKLGPGKGSEDDSRLKFKKDGITVNVIFKTPARKKIAYIKFSQNVGMVGPYRVDSKHEFAMVSSEAAPSVILAAKDARPLATKVPAKASPSKPAPVHTSAAADRRSADPFYNAIMNVIESGEEEMFKDIKKEAMSMSNFWNYKYTYSTSVSIPGEKYNMLYSFPFQSSQLDFVSVLDEADGKSPSIAAKYAEVEAKLKAYFKPSEGWSYSYTVNQEDPKGIKDFELKNPKLGSIVLDYSTNPYGKHVLYLRFLLQYT
jgi:hypothetical protein